VLLVLKVLLEMTVLLVHKALKEYKEQLGLHIAVIVV
jgi:hypothetical protein